MCKHGLIDYSLFLLEVDNQKPSILKNEATDSLVRVESLIYDSLAGTFTLKNMES